MINRLACRWRSRVQALFLVLVASILLASCMVVRKPTTEELLMLDHPPATVTAKIDALLPPALAWYERVEAQWLPEGRRLTDSEREVASRFGVRNPDRVRVVLLDEFPLPEDPELLAAARQYGMGSKYVGGRTIGYLIMLKPKYKNNSTILAHELVHIGQHDRLGRTAFVRRYLVELEMMGYARSPLELEAYEQQRFKTQGEKS